MVAVALGVGAALCWGFADFLGGLRTRRLTLAAVLLVSQFTGLAAIAVVVAVGNLEAPSAGGVAPALAAGVCQLAGIAALYRALAIGTMSVISPLSASGAAALPVIVGVATGERPGALVFAGMAVALLGVTLASRTPTSAPTRSRRMRAFGPHYRSPSGLTRGVRDRNDFGSRQGLALAAVAALGFGGFFVGMDAAVDDVEPFWALLAARLSAAAALAVVLLAVRPRVGASAAALPSLALIGLLDVGANGCFTLGVETGLVSVVSVLASLYPVGTVLLARALLGERLVAPQAAGVTLALAGVALIATG